MELEQTILDYFRTGYWRSSQPCPIQSEKGVTYVRHNSMRMGNASDSQGGIIVAYLWNGTIVGWDRLSGARLQGDMHHHMDTTDGRHMVSNPFAPSTPGSKT